MSVHDDLPGRATRGRWPHAHFEVYPTLDAATSASGKLATSQLAFPRTSATRCTPHGLRAERHQPEPDLAATDMVFSDGASLETPTVTGSVDAGYVATPHRASLSTR